VRTLAGVVTRRPLDDTGGPTPDVTPAAVAFDLERLTDDVVARLDDRLTAHRERLGQAF